MPHSWKRYLQSICQKKKSLRLHKELQISRKTNDYKKWAKVLALDKKTIQISREGGQHQNTRNVYSN